MRDFHPPVDPASELVTILLFNFLLWSPVAWFLLWIREESAPVRPLTILMAVLGPLWLIWVLLLARAEGDEGQRRWRQAANAVGVCTTACTAATFLFSLQVLAAFGFALDVGLPGAAENLSTNSQARGLFLIWVVPTLLTVLCAAGTLAAFLRIKSGFGGA
jgi:steroid 5-alpha reductase family enzyme